MSFRHSFTTEYIYCSKCYTRLRSILQGVRTKDITLNLFDTVTIPILTGYISTSYTLAFEVLLQVELKETIEQCICHPVQLAVLQEDTVVRAWTILPLKDGDVSSNEKEPNV